MKRFFEIVFSDFEKNFLPDLCFICESELDKNHFILCENCLRLLKPVPLPRCPKCGYPLKKIKCQRCYHLRPKFDIAYQIFEFNDILRKLVHRLKYEGYLKLADFFAGIMCEFAPDNYFSDIDIVCWIPDKKLFYKGYNQSYLIAKAIAKRINKILCDKNLIKKVRLTYSQTKFHNYKDRYENIRDSFEVSNPLYFYQKGILIVDDVMTSGNTINELAKKLKKYKPKVIKALTLAQAYCKF